MLSCVIEKSPESIKVKVSGKLTEMAEASLQSLKQDLGDPARVIFNTRELSDINSLGAKLWILTMIELGKRPGLALEFEQCSEVLMRYRALIPGMTGSAKIRSVVISYDCNHCGASTNGQIDEADFSIDEELKPVACSSCGKTAVSQFDPEELFSFMEG